MMVKPLKTILRYYNEDGTMKPAVKEEYLAEGMSLEGIKILEDNARAEIEDYLNFKDNLKDKLIARAGLTVEEELSEGYMTLDDLI